MAKRRETLRELFDRLAANPQHVAERMGIGRSTVYGWLSGDRRPKPWTRAELADALGVTDEEVRRALERTAAVADG